MGSEISEDKTMDKDGIGLNEVAGESELAVDYLFHCRCDNQFTWRESTAICPLCAEKCVSVTEVEDEKG